MKKEVKTIFFDIGGVLQISKNRNLLNNYPEEKKHHTLGVHDYMTSKIKIPIDQYFDALEEVYPKSIDGTLSKKETLKKMSKNLGVKKQKIEKLYKKAYKKYLKLNKPLLKKAIKLKKIGYQIAILSDMWPVSKEVLIPEKLSYKFHDSIVSCDVGTRKPRPKIYKLALKRLKSKPSESLFIDNQLWNIDAAKKLGIKTIQFKNNKQLFSNPLWKSLFIVDGKKPISRKN